MAAKIPRGSRAYVIRELMFDDLDYIAANLGLVHGDELEAASGPEFLGRRVLIRATSSLAGFVTAHS